MRKAQQITWTMGYGVSWRTYHVGVVKREVTNSIRANCPIMLEEMRNAMDTLIGSPAGIVRHLEGHAGSALHYQCD